jgi:pyruvyltransferase
MFEKPFAHEEAPRTHERTEPRVRASPKAGSRLLAANAKLGSMTNRTEEEIVSRWKENGTVPFVSICVISYNHEPFIGDALDGILRQETTFPYEIVLDDDCSTDNTAGIIRRYMEKYPNIIHANLREQNLGPTVNFAQTLDRAKGKYIAICEGDDYWIDPSKLQKQVDFLEQNEDYSVCYHCFMRKHDNGMTRSPQKAKDTITFDDYLHEQPSIQSTTAVFRNTVKPLIPSDWAKKVEGSYFMFMRLARTGLIKFMAEYMSVYRMHTGGIWSGKAPVEQAFMSLRNQDVMIAYLKSTAEAHQPLRRSYICKALTYVQYCLVRKDFSHAKEFFSLAVKQKGSMGDWLYFFYSYADGIRRKIGLRQRIINACVRMKYFVMDAIYTDRNSVKVFWYKSIQNFGDSINPILIQLLTGKKAVWVNPLYYSRKHVLAVGSILSTANSHSVVWGSGFLSEEDKCVQRSTEVRAVRGPESRQKLLEGGVECPEVFGDPALLLPKVYSPNIEKENRLGVVVHYADANNSWLEGIQKEQGVKVLNIQEPDPLRFIDDVLSCERIASSSLHGIILADAYGIPSTWIKLSEGVKGGGFKFLDYFTSVGRQDREPLVIDSDTSLDDLHNQFCDYKINIDLEALLGACPFKCKASVT